MNSRACSYWPRYDWPPKVMPDSVRVQARLRQCPATHRNRERDCASEKGIRSRYGRAYARNTGDADSVCSRITITSDLDIQAFTSLCLLPGPIPAFITYQEAMWIYTEQKEPGPRAGARIRTRIFRRN